LNVAHPGAKVFLGGMTIIPLALLLVLVVHQLTK